ncbi:hypothetical protein BAL199_18456 [alpha proteobacterium BAL199]|nr:hypothetical protein BAL199_18456 [alpha proteobacterium BAL199]
MDRSSFTSDAMATMDAAASTQAYAPVTQLSRAGFSGQVHAFLHL